MAEELGLLKPPATRLFVLQFVKVDTKENINSRVTGHLWGESNDDRWSSLTKASNAEAAYVMTLTYIKCYMSRVGSECN